MKFLIMSTLLLPTLQLVSQIKSQETSLKQVNFKAVSGNHQLLNNERNAKALTDLNQEYPSKNNLLETISNGGHSKSQLKIPRMNKSAHQYQYQQLSPQFAQKGYANLAQNPSHQSQAKQENTYNFNEIKGRNNKIQGNSNAIYGNQNIIIGAGNRLHGHNNNAIGNKNKFHGNNEVAIGHNNQLIGNLNRVMGRGNMIAGHQNQAVGSNNLIEGHSNAVDGNQNIVANGNQISLDIKHPFLGQGQQWAQKSVKDSMQNQNNKIKGSKNKLSGSSSFVQGDQNKVKGSSNAVNGNRNDVRGNQNTVLELKTKDMLQIVNLIKNMEKSTNLKISPINQNSKFWN